LLSRLLSVATLPVLALSLAGAAGAQQIVGSLPSRSPYHDVAGGQRVTLFGGYFMPQKDEIGATPRSGPMLGLRYGVSVGSAAEFFARGAAIHSHRAAFDPTAAPAARALGDVTQSLYLMDLGFAVNVTGAKSWHRIIPTASFSVGILTGPATAKKDPYSFGTQFAISSAAGFRIVPSNSFELRFEAGSTLYQSHYPTAYFTTTSANTTALLGSGTAKSGYRNAWSLTAGASVPIFR